MLLYCLRPLIAAKNEVSFRTGPDCYIAMSMLHWWMQTLKKLCVAFFLLTEADLQINK